MTIKGWHATHVGRVREHNEDRFSGSCERGLFVVADGMGGHEAGEVAAQLAVLAVTSAWPTGVTEAAARKAVDAAAMAVIEAATAARRRGTPGGNMGTTLVLLSLQPEAAIVCHVGDSRCYLLRGDEFTCLTRDHSVVEDAIQRNVDKELVEMMRATDGNLITNALGTGYRGATSMSMQPMRGDVFLLCSDGLHGMLTDEAIGTILKQWRPANWDVADNKPPLPPGRPVDVAEALVAAANHAGGKDNVTVNIAVFE